MIRLHKVWIISSILISLLVLVASLGGIFNPITYSKESANWALQAMGQDIGNLIAVPTLLMSTYFLAKKSVKAYFVWIGTLMYFIYAYTVYAFFVHFNYLFLVYIAILGLSAYTLIGGIAGQNLFNLLKSHTIKTIKPASILLIIIGTLFGVLWLSDVLPALITGESPKSIVLAELWVNPIHVIDLSLVLPGMIITGILLLKKKMLGYLFTAPWLTFSVLMGSSIVANMILELNNGNSEAIVPFTMVGVIVITSLIVLINYLRQTK